MSVIWTLLTFITRYVTDTLYYNIWKGNRISFIGGQFHADPLTWSNWHLEILVFEEGENQRTRRKTLDEGEKQHCWKAFVLSIAPSLLSMFVLMLIKEIEIYMAIWSMKKTRIVIGSLRDLKFKIGTAKIHHSASRLLKTRY